MQICLALVVIKSCNYENFNHNISELLGMTNTQAVFCINYLIEHNFIQRENYNFALSNEGYQYLNDNNLNKVTLEDLLTLEDEDRDEFDYKLKVSQYIPQEYRNEV